jgi:hypothetical protein
MNQSPAKTVQTNAQAAPANYWNIAPEQLLTPLQTTQLAQIKG